jgi:hypothetical protein
LLRNVSALAPRKRVTVRVSGIIYGLPAEPPPQPEVVPDAIEAASAKLLESDAQTRALIESFGPKLSEALESIGEVVATVAEGQAEIVQSVRENTRTLHLPVKPVLDKTGKLIEARRVQE